MRLALCQLNPTVGDVRGNTDRIVAAAQRARAEGADLAIIPEQAILGYPAKDMLLRRALIDANVAALEQIAAATREVAVVVGFAQPNDRPRGRGLYNAAALLAGGGLVATSRKRLLPTYDVFDELRYFEPATAQTPIDFAGRRIGLTICEDMWSGEQGLFARPIYSCDPLGDLAAAGADLMINISASPWSIDKHPRRIAMMADHARRLNVPLVYVNQVGGNDDVLFDGASCVLGPEGEVLAQARSFEEEMLLIDLEQPAAARIEPIPSGIEGVHDALVMGLRDYVRKCGFSTVVIGVSGGVDSAVVAALAVEALGPQNVRTVAMPSRYSSDHSLSDARALAGNLGARFDVIEIEPMHVAYESTLKPIFAGREADATEENLQARIRGATLMALSNKFGSLLLTTGNKSELAVGYCTLYGDMAGGLAVISDLPKTMVYALARHINDRAARALIPAGTLAKPPSAELRADQLDQQTLPPYDVLDAILERYEERLQSPDEIKAALSITTKDRSETCPPADSTAGDRSRTGLSVPVPPELIDRVIAMIQRSEYKRQQAAPGLRVTSRAFGSGRRMPIAARHG